MADGRAGLGHSQHGERDSVRPHTPHTCRGTVQYVPHRLWLARLANFINGTWTSAVPVPRRLATRRGALLSEDDASEYE